MAQQLDVGFVGVGDQGGPMAHAIAEAGHHLHVWARRPEATAPYAEAGATVHDTPAALAARVDNLGLCVVSEADVRQVLFEHGALAACRPGTVVMIHSTISPSACRAIAAEAAESGVRVIDVPVSGGRVAAEARTLSLLVGGSEADVADAMSVLSSYSETIIHCGSVGAGQVVKILNNLLMNANLAAAELVLELGEHLGLERGSLHEAMLASSARSFSLERLGQRPQFDEVRVAVGRKDIGLARTLIDEVDDPTVKLLHQIAEIAVEVRDHLTMPPNEVSSRPQTTVRLTS